MFKCISLNNEISRGQGIVGRTHNFNFDGYNFYFGDIRSSRVKSITIEDKLMTVETKNSIYKFEKEM